MSADRCPSCAGAVRPDASWCGQCYADLRPPAPPAPAPAPAPVPEQSVVTELDAPAPQLASAPVTLLADVPADAAEAPAAPLPGVVPNMNAMPAWPCLRCGVSVPFEEDECPKCHSRFLASPLPGADRTLLDRLPRGQRKASTAFLVMLIGGLTLTGVFVGLFTLLATIFG